MPEECKDGESTESSEDKVTSKSVKSGETRQSSESNQSDSILNGQDLKRTYADVAGGRNLEVLNIEIEDQPMKSPSNRVRYQTQSDDVDALRSPGSRGRQRFASERTGERIFNMKVVNKWKSLAKQIAKLGDPWFMHNIVDQPTERCKRYRYSSLRKHWSEDIVEVKMQIEPFARGAMRECFRMKKLSKFCQNDNWKLAHNYVAKRYMAETARQVIFEDVRLQMDAKLWAEEYNRYDPPKKIDIAQMCILEFIDRGDDSLYHMEHFIEGEYIKYNSNSGFVSEETRQTPHAFSHFTFERSGHGLIIVDVQGVGDLYTDPQIHTADGKGYGDGNLGTRGMALFFHSHICNGICKQLDLSPFDLSINEHARLRDPSKKLRLASRTVFKKSRQCESVMALQRQHSTGTGSTGNLSTHSDHSEESHDDSSSIPPPLYTNWNDPTEQLRQRALSTSSRDGSSVTDSTDNISIHSNDINERPAHIVRFAQDDMRHSDDVFDHQSRPCRKAGHAIHRASSNPKINSEMPVQASHRLIRTISLNPDEADDYDFDGEDDYFDMSAPMSPVSNMSASSTAASSVTREMERERYWAEMRKQSRPSIVPHHLTQDDMDKLNKLHEDKHQSTSSAPNNEFGSVLGQVHLDMARYYELGRFNLDQQHDIGKGSHDSGLHNMELENNKLVIQEYDKASAWFHLDLAVKCNVFEAVLTMAYIYLGLSHDLLKDFSMEGDDDNAAIGFDLMLTAAHLGDRSAMLYLAEAFETGNCLPGDQKRSFYKAVRHYENAMSVVTASDDEGAVIDGNDEHANYLILEHLAEMHRTGDDEHATEPRLVKDPQRAGDLYNEAAEAAIEAMKGKLANKFYMKAEECYGEVEDEPEL